MAKLKIDKLIVVEGKYDKIKLSNIVDANIIDVGGFSLYNNKNLISTLKTLAKQNGVIILTDSDVAGYKIRVYLNKILSGCQIQNVLAPQIQGKESRKTTYSKQGFLGIEGIDDSTILSLLSQYSNSSAKKVGDISVSNLYELGLCGKPESKQKKNLLLKNLGVQQNISNNFLLNLLNQRFTTQQFYDYVEKVLKDF